MAIIRDASWTKVGENDVVVIRDALFAALNARAMLADLRSRRGSGKDTYA